MYKAPKGNLHSSLSFVVHGELLELGSNVALGMELHVIPVKLIHLTRYIGMSSLLSGECIVKTILKVPHFIIRGLVGRTHQYR
jgi:hypothetical protein